VLLAIKGKHVEPRLLSSASGLCRRLDAGLDIMLSSADKKHSPLLENFIMKMQQEGIDCRLTQQDEFRSKDIVHYANTHECITSVMIASLNNWLAPGDEKGRNPWHKLDCPLVVAIPD